MLLAAGICAGLAQAPPQTRDGELLRLADASPMAEIAPEATGPETPESRKLSPVLRRVVESRTGDEETRALQLTGILQGDRAPLVVQTAAVAQVPGVEAEIRRRGGTVDTAFENTIWATLPAAAISGVSGLAAVQSIAVQPSDRASQAAAKAATQGTGTAGDGIRAAHLGYLLGKGLSGQGVKIGILDFGFGGYSQLLKTGKVRAARAERAFPASYGIENQERHGSGSAEIISAAAPGSELYLASFDGRQGHFVQAVWWLLAQGVNVISYSAGSTEAPSDGTDVISRLVDFTTRRHGVLWVVAAGNYGQRHWEGYSEVNRDGLLETSPRGLTGFEITSLSNTLRVVVRWDDWGANPRAPSATQDIDAYLLARREDGKGWDVVQKSTDAQNGGAAVPVETIDYSAPNMAGKQFILRLKARHLTRRVKVHVFLETEGRLYPSVPTGSVVTPATARYALAVGGIDILTNQPAHYSSQGPTDDWRLKPEVSASTNTVSWAYAAGNGRFPGTSASAPHVAGFAALLKEKNPQLTAAELRLMIMRAVLPRGTPQPNMVYGYGQIDGMAIPAWRERPAESSGRDGPIAIPKEFGGSISRRTLMALRNMAGDAHDGLNVRIASAQDLYRIGDGLKLSVHASDDCSCLAFLRDAMGNYSLLPLSEEKTLALRRGQQLVLPRSRDEFLEIAGPAGSEEVLLVCAAHPVNLSGFDGRGNAGGVAVAADGYSIEKAARKFQQ